MSAQLNGVESHADYATRQYLQVEGTPCIISLAGKEARSTSAVDKVQYGGLGHRNQNSACGSL